MAARVRGYPTSRAPGRREPGREFVLLRCRTLPRTSTSRRPARVSPRRLFNYDPAGDRQRNVDGIRSGGDSGPTALHVCEWGFVLERRVRNCRGQLRSRVPAKVALGPSPSSPDVLPRHARAGWKLGAPFGTVVARYFQPDALKGAVVH